MFIHKWILDFKTENLNEKLENVVKIIEKYNLIDIDVNDFWSLSLDATNLPQVFKNFEENKTVYNIYYENLHFHFALTDNETVYSIRIKDKENTYWHMPTFIDENDIVRVKDISHPLDKNFEIYVYYNLPVLNITRSEGFNYKHGTWDKYFLKTINNFFNYFEQFKEENIISKSYKN